MFTPHLGPGEAVPAQAARALAQADKVSQAGLQRSSPGPAGQAQGVTQDKGLLIARELRSAAASRVPVSVPDLRRSAQQLAQMLEQVCASMCGSCGRLTLTASWLRVFTRLQRPELLLVTVPASQPARLLLTCLALAAGAGAQGAAGPRRTASGRGALPDLLAASAGWTLQQGRCPGVPGGAPGRRLGLAVSPC